MFSSSYCRLKFVVVTYNRKTVKKFKKILEHIKDCVLQTNHKYNMFT